MSSSSPSPILLILIISTFMINISSSSPDSPDRYLKALTNPPPSSNTPTESIEVTKPPPPSNPINPNCSILVLQNDFNNTPTSPPFTTLYSPPANCTGPWNKIFLEYSVSSDDAEQDDRISGVWLNGVEILRTSTPQGNPSGSIWKVRKDVSRYSSLFTQSNLTLSVMLESEFIDDWFTGFYQVNVSLFYYQDQDLNLTRISSIELIEPIKLNRKLGGLPETSGLGMYNAGAFTNETSPNLIIPVSDNGGEGCWFRIKNESDIHSKTIQIPQNTKKAVLEIYVSAHGNDEFWYSNVPNAYIESNHLSSQRGNGAFRQVIATVDGVTVGSVTPIPVIFSGGINPLFWDPVVAMGAFNLPTYDIDLTPFLGFLLDGKNHSFGLGVAYSNSVWLVNANLHLWLDHGSDIVTAQSISYGTAPMQLQNQTQFETLDGQFKIEGQRKTEYSGWVNSSAGNFTTRIYDEFKFKNEIKISNNGQDKEVEQKIKLQTEIRIENDIGHEISKSIISREYPLKIKISTLPGAEADTFVSTTDVSHSTKEKYTRALSSNEQIQIESENSQESNGWMIVKDRSVLSGSGSTSQTLTFKDLNGFYSRVVSASNGKILQDDSTLASVSPFSA
ncbi:hypothetical protein MKW92_041294 [Papaver armeniacum]|nr:hypothetical protein MKW92_041294 [Papaver armeniacum]